MTRKSVAPVIALAFLVIASSVGNPRGEKSLLSRRKNPRQLMFAEEESFFVLSNVLNSSQYLT